MFNEHRTIFRHVASPADDRRTIELGISHRDRSLLPVISGMARLILLVGAGAALVASIGCGADTSTQERQPDSAIRATVVATAAATILVPQNPADMHIRRDLNLAIARDTDLRNRLISFIVSNGDISVTGTVQTEKERRKVNDLAMNIGGVKSVANALQVAEAE